jgi:type I restriction enzyme S subunit
MIDGLRPYASYRASPDRWLTQFPSTWERVRIKYLLREIDRRTQTGEEPLLSMRRDHGLVPLTQFSDKVAEPKALLAYKLVRPGELVVNRMQAGNGLVFVARIPGLISPDYAIFRPVREVNLDYLELLFRSYPMRAKFRSESTGLGTGTAGFLRLYGDSLGAIEIGLPSAEEQALIVRFLEHADRRIGRYIRSKKKLIALLNEQRQGTIHQAVTCGLNPRAPLKPSGVRWLGNVPQHWEVWQVGHFGRVGNGSTPSRGNSAYWSGGSYPWLNSSSVHRSPISGSDQFVTDLALRECHLPRVPPSSVLVAITGQGKTRGRAAVLATEATINQHIAYITPRRDVVSAEYLHLVFSGAYRELRSISDDSGSTKGALTCADIGHFKVALPGLEEQEKLIGAVRLATQRLEAALVRSQHEIELLTEYRARLIADVVTGKIDVREAGAQLPDAPAPSEDEGLLDEAATESDAADLDDAEAEIVA